MKIRNKKAFTLIELLAVIVILAVIALIATPIILNIIDDAREASKKRSIENYKKSVQNAFVTSQLNGQELASGTYTSSSDGKTLTNGSAIVNVEYSGSEVKCTSVEYTNGKVVLDGCAVVTNASTDTAPICTLDGTEKNTGKFSAGDRYLCKVDPNKKAYGFYVLTTVDKSTVETINLISEANINLTTGEPITDPNSTDKGLVAWISEEDWLEAGGEDLSNDGGYCQYTDLCVENKKGPITAMNALQGATSSWTNTGLQSIIVNEWDDENGGKHSFTTPYTLKARLPYKSEVNAVGCESGSCPLWLVNYLEGSQSYPGKTEISGVSGYWLLTSHTYNFAESVIGYGDMCYNAASYAVVGLRPVITVSKSNLSQ